jgi:hypothetical protein
MGGLFLWSDPSGCPVPGVTRRLALWSADFPRWHVATAVIRSAWGISSYHNFNLDYSWKSAREAQTSGYQSTSLRIYVRMALLYDQLEAC